MKSKVAKQSELTKVQLKDFQNAELESEQAGGDFETAQKQLNEVETSLDAHKSEIADLKAQKAQAKSTFDIISAQLDDERAKLSGFDDELESLHQASRQKQQRIADEGLEKQKLGHEVEKFDKEQQTAKEHVTQMLADHEWIEDEQDQFGLPGTPYDFQRHNISECRTTLKTLTERFQGMKRKINPKVSMCFR